MTSPLISWFLAIPAILYLLFYITAMIFVIFKRSDQSSAKTFAVIGVGILLFLQVFGTVANVVLARYLASAEYVFYHGVIGIITTVMHLLALSLLMAAIFVGRSSGIQPDSQDKRTPIASENPYSPPAV